MKKYNKDTIVSVKAYDKFPTTLYVWKPELRILGIRFRKEGVYSALWNIYVEDPTNNLTDYIVTDKVVYELPEVVITFVNGETITSRFDTYEEAKEVAKDYTENGNWIERGEK